MIPPFTQEHRREEMKPADGLRGLRSSARSSHHGAFEVAPRNFQAVPASFERMPRTPPPADAVQVRNLAKRASPADAGWVSLACFNTTLTIEEEMTRERAGSLLHSALTPLPWQNARRRR